MKHIAYYRVSTQKQGQSGLGLEAQRQSVLNFIKGAEVVEEITEVETGTNKRERAEINRAIELCKKHNATLVIAKLDRLARNVAFTAALMDSGIDFVAVDNPHANRLTIHILSAIAEHEAKLISERTKAGLAIAKQRGKKLGSPLNLTEAARAKSIDARKAKAANNENNKRAAGYIKALRGSGMSFQSIADKLNNEGFRSSRGKDFTAKAVQLLSLKTA
jgi:DNA invertase Pin-like site-specific DNA recombinase